MTEDEAIERLQGLLKKKRSALKQGLIRAMMVQTEDLEDQIRKIEVIDLASDDEARLDLVKRPKGRLLRPEKVPDAEPEPAPTPLPTIDSGLVEAQRVDECRLKLVFTPPRGKLWAYLTKEHGSMVRFGARTSTLKRGFFPFTLHLSPEARAFLSKVLKGQVLPVLEQTLPLVIRRGWLHLTKVEYNLIAALADLVHRAGGEVPDEPLAGGILWDPVIPALRVFWTAPDLVERTLAAWDLATTRLGCPEKVRRDGGESIRTLLEPRPEALSLPEALQALVSIRCRRLVEWNEGTPLEPGVYFRQDSFDCSYEVQSEIDRAVDVLVGQLEALDREAQEIRRIRYFLPSQDLLTPWVGRDTRDEPARWCRPFLYRLGNAFGALLGGTVVFADGSRAELIQSSSLDSILARLKVLADQLGAPESAGNPDLLAAVGRVVMNLGKSLVVLIRTRSLSADPLVRAADPSLVTDPLPFEDSVLELPEEWAGMTVVDALVRAAQVSLQAGRLLGESSLDSNLAKEDSLPGRAGELLTRLGRLVPSHRLEILRARWGTPGTATDVPEPEPTSVS